MKRVWYQIYKKELAKKIKPSFSNLTLKLRLVQSKAVAGQALDSVFLKRIVELSGDTDGAIHIFQDRSLRRVTSHSSDVVISDIKPVASWVPHSRPVYSHALKIYGSSLHLGWQILPWWRILCLRVLQVSHTHNGELGYRWNSRLSSNALQVHIIQQAPKRFNKNRLNLMIWKDTWSIILGSNLAWIQKEYLKTQQSTNLQRH